MKVGDFEIEVTSGRTKGGWQSVGALPNGKKVTSAPSVSREAAEYDVKQQALAHLYPQRKYDVNRPFESMESNKEATIVNHLADRLLEQVPDGTYEISAEGDSVNRPECPNCGGPGNPKLPGQYECMNCQTVFSVDISQHPPGSVPFLPPKASFYPSDGGGVTSV